MNKNWVFTLQTPDYEFTKDEAKKLLSSLMTLLEAFGVEVVGTLTTEETKNEKEQA